MAERGHTIYPSHPMIKHWHARLQRSPSSPFSSMQTITEASNVDWAGRKETMIFSRLGNVFYFMLLSPEMGSVQGAGESHLQPPNLGQARPPPIPPTMVPGADVSRYHCHRAACMYVLCVLRQARPGTPPMQAPGPSLSRSVPAALSRAWCRADPPRALTE